MIGRIYHVGLTVSDLDRSVAFYRDILGLAFQGEIFMEGKETDKMFRKSNCKARVAYLNGSKAIETPPVELIQFVDSEIHKEQSDLFTTSISEVCFYTDDIDSVYKTLTFTALCDVLLFRDELFYYESFGLFAVLILVQLAATGAALSSHRKGYLRWSSYRHVCC